MRFAVLLPAFFISCTTAGGSCQTPLHDACSQKAEEVSAELAKIAAQRNASPDEMTTEFVNACEGQLQADLDQTLTALQAIADSGSSATPEASLQTKDSAP